MNLTPRERELLNFEISRRVQELEEAGVTTIKHEQEEFGDVTQQELEELLTKLNPGS
jgi:hypothetical protein